MTPTRWLDRKQAAAYCAGCSPRFFEEHIRPNVRVVSVGRKPMWDAHDLDRFLESRKSEDAGEFLS